MSAAGAQERAEFAASFLELGPDAPTILPGWDAPDLLEHLLLRESLPHLMVGSALPGPLGRRAGRAREDLRAAPWEQLVEQFRNGPGPLSPAGTMDSLSGDGELLIHHEDLRRAQDGWEPRRLSAAQDASAWKALGLLSRVVLRVPVDVTFVSPRGGMRRRARRSTGSVRVHGEPIELLLWASGRDDVARVRSHGDERGQQALHSGRRGL